MGHKKGKSDASPIDRSVAELKALREKALEASDPHEKWARTTALLDLKSCLSPALLLATAAKLAYIQGLDVLLALDFASEDVKQFSRKADNAPCLETLWQSAYDWALAGAQKHKSAVCAVMCAELIYIMSGSDLDERCKVLEGFTILKSSVWRDPAEDILDPKDTRLTPCEQVKGDLKADRVKKSLEIVGAVLEKIKSSSGLARYRRKGHGGLLDGPVGMLIRIDGRCSLLVPGYLRKLDEARRVAVNLHNILPDQNLQNQLEQWKKEEAEKKKSRKVLLQHAAIEQAAVAQPALHRMALPLQLYIDVHQLQEELKEASQQPLDSQPEQMLFLTSRCADLPSKLLHKLPPAQQKKADSLAKEVKHFVEESYADLSGREERFKKHCSFFEVPAASVKEAIEQDTKSSKEEAAYANGLLADWCEQGKPQAVANISSGTCAKGSLLQEYVESLAAPAVEQLAKAGETESGPDMGDIAPPSAEELIKVAVEGQGLLWEGELPGEVRIPSPAELKRAVEQLGTEQPQAAAAQDAASLAVVAAGERLHPMAPAIGGCGALAEPLHRHFRRAQQDASRSAACLDLKDLLKAVAEPAHGLVVEDMEASLTRMSLQTRNQEAVAEMAAGNAGGGIIDNDWNIRMEPIRDTAESRYQVITLGQSRPQYKIRAELRPDFCDSIDDGDWNLKLKVEARRARGRLLLVLRHLLWRLEAVRCEACWEVDAPPHESYFQEPICIIADALRMDDESILLDSSHLVYPAPPKDGQGEVTPAQIELPIVSRFRFYEVADGPGRGCGPANIAKFVPGFDVPSGHNADAAAAADKDPSEDWAAAQSVPPTQQNGVHADAQSSAAAEPQESAATGAAHAADAKSGSEGEVSSGRAARKWLGTGPSPLDVPEQEEYNSRNPHTKMEILQDIFDGLEMLRESRLLAPWLVSYLASYMIQNLKEEGVNWLQLHWEHLAFLSEKKLAIVRDIVLQALALHCHVLTATSEAAALQRAYHVTGHFNLVEGRTDCFQMYSPPLQQALAEAVDVVQQEKQNVCKGCQGCNGKGSNGQAEAHERSTANGDSAEARQQAEELEVLRAKLAGTKELELAEEYIEVQMRDNHPEDWTALLVDILFGVSGRVNALRPPTTYSLKEGAVKVLRRRILRATACFSKVIQEKARREDLLHAVANTLKVHLDYVEPLKDGSLDSGNLSADDVRRVTEWLDAAEEARLRVQGLWWDEQVQVSTSRLSRRRLAADFIKDQLAKAYRRRQSAGSGTERAKKEDEDIEEKRSYMKLCEDQRKREQMHLDNVLDEMEQFHKDPRRKMKTSGLKRDLQEHASGRLRLSAEDVLKRLAEEQKYLQQGFRSALVTLFRCDLHIATARLAAMRIIRICEMELTVCFGEYLEKWLLQGLRNTLHKAARERLEREQEANMAALVEEEEKLKAVKAKKQAKKKAAKAKSLVPSIPLSAFQAAGDVHSNGDTADATPSTSQQGPPEARASEAGDLSAAVERPIDPASADTTEQWDKVATTSAEADGWGDEEKDQPELASSAEASTALSLVQEEAGGFEYVESKSKKKKKKNKKKTTEDEEASAASASTAWWRPEGAGDEDTADEWQTAKPRRQQQKRGDRGDSAGPPHQLNGHSEEPKSPLPQPRATERAPAAPMASPRAVPVSVGDYGSPGPASRTQPAQRCAKCREPGHKVMECPELAHLPPFVRGEILMALLEGNAQRVHLLLARPPTNACHWCDAPEHSVYICPQLAGVKPMLKADLATAYETCNLKLKRSTLAELERHLPARSRSGTRPGSDQPPAPPSSGSRPQPGAPSRAGLAQPPPPPPDCVSGRSEAESWRRQVSAGSDASFGNDGSAPEQPSARPQPRGAAADSRPRPRGAAAEDARPSPRSSMRAVATPFVPSQPGTPRDGVASTSAPQINHVQAVRTVPIPANATYRPLQQGAGPASPALGVPLQRPAQGLRKDSADDNFSTIMDMLCPQPSLDAPPAERSWAGVAEGQEARAWANKEEDDMQTAIQASLHNKRRLGPMSALMLGPNGDLAGASCHQQPSHRVQQASMELLVATPGLQNQIGEYNCFLNVIIQSLWNCRQFREPFKTASAAFFSAQSNAVVAALAELFATFEAEERQGSRSVIAPTRLREALDALNSHAFQIGEMSDAAEVLGAVYDSLKEVPGGAELVNAVFGLRVRELVHCGSCGRDTHCTRYTQFFYNVSATALRLQAMLNGEDGRLPPLGRLLWEIEAQDVKSCDTDVGGCGQLNSIQHLLEGAPPNVFTVQLAWESQHESSDAIRATLAAIQEEVDVGHIYKAQEPRQYRLRSMVCYYGAHYHAFVHASGQWIMFDDANTSAVGGWDAVMHKCQLGKIQPSVLFFEAMGG